MRRRASGILLHISSLPSGYGIGDLGPEAYRWIDFLAEAKQSFWQVLPVNPTSAKGHNSPYQAVSAFAGDPLYISPSLLRDEGLLTENDLGGLSVLPGDKVDYREVNTLKRRLLGGACERANAGENEDGFNAFCAQHSEWLDDYAEFTALRQRFPGQDWSEWPAPYRDRDPESLEELSGELRDAIAREKYYQYLFFKQWSRLKQYANQNGVQIIGDLPYYVGYDCADVWGNPGLFKLNESKAPTFVAGVPPDVFSDTGQLWGNPVYDWGKHAQTGYAWWLARVKRNLELFDIVRIDHFRGFSAYWEVPSSHDTAMEGKWVDGPGEDFFRALLKYRPFPPLIAEDLGIITPDVRELIHKHQLPGMKVLLFAFDGESGSHPYSLHNHMPNSVVYTGTHDNNTVRGWYEDEATPEQIQRLSDYLGGAPSNSQIHWDVIRLAMMSVSKLVVIPVQDILGLDGGARMNRPAVASGNWEWRLNPGQATSEVAEELARLTEIYGRA
jgi:4-alpha-glucanotransferase